MDFLNSIILVVGFGAVVYTNLKTYQSVTNFHDNLKTKLDDIINDINDINNHLMELKPKKPEK